MTARLRATLLAAALFVAFAIALVAQPTNYILFTPGPTVDVLGSYNSAPIISIKDHPVYGDTGELRMLTVSVTPPGEYLSLASAIRHWLTDDTSIYPSVFVYPPNTTQATNQQQGVQDMTSAQDLAKVAALHAAGIAVPSEVVIGQVDAKGPSNGKIQAGDVLTKVAGVAVSTPQDAVNAIRRFHPGDEIPLTLQRAGKQIEVTIKSVAAGTSGAAASKPHIGVQLGSTYKFPFPITISIPDNITGPSAGMIFALTIYDKITTGSLTKGHDIAGTGTIDASGNVGAIGGIAQKIQAAQRDGAQLFLAPAANCDMVRKASYNSSTMRIVKVSTLADAINAIKTWTANPNAPLPGCS